MVSARRQPAAALLLCAVLVLSGCAASNASSPATPPAPTPPQISIANAVNALAQTLDAAITALQTARTNGQISAGDVANAEKVAAIIATTGKAVNAELRSADDWPTQKAKILGIVTAAGLQGTLKTLPSGAATILAASVALFDQISVGVGGPQL